MIAPNSGPAPDPAPASAEPPAKSSGLLRRVAATILIGLLLTGILWYTVFSAVTAALVGTGGTLIILAVASVSDTFEAIFETIANIVLGIFGAIAAFFAAIFIFFDF